jgi:UDP-GlcNAc:undecaprenyl-phosphate/decaprenyl-phosphate GlcNAc-1-phosphate transferase
VITTVAGVVVGAVLCGLLWTAASSAFEQPALARTNFRGAPVVTGVGLLIPLTMVIFVGGLRLVVLLADAYPVPESLLGPALVAALGFGLLGFLDDVVGAGQSGGFRGHLRSLATGQLTSGMLKLLGGAALGVYVASALPRGDEGVVGALRDGAVIALAANLANLLDRAPGRVIKWTAIAFAACTLVSRSPTLVGPGVGVGAGLALLPSDLRERTMLGDAGANALGGLCGLAALSALPTALGRWALLVALLGLNAVSEWVSFSAVIARVPPLRWFDRLGRAA